jgi:hypothetical protein
MAKPPKPTPIEQVVSDFKTGKQLGQEILGPEGLGRVREQSQIQDVESKLASQAEGFSGAESTARRETALQRVQQTGEADRRSLQANLARSGVKGGAAAEALLAQAGQGAQQRAQIERDLFVAGEDAARAGTQQLADFQLQTTKFDIGQAAKEKNIVAQGGLSAAQIASGERSAKLQAASAAAAAQAQARAACFVAGTKIQMNDGSTKEVQNLKIGDITFLGGAVTLVKPVNTYEDIYEYMGAYASASHEVYSDGEIVTLEEAGKLAYSQRVTVVYKLNTENGVYVTNNFISLNSVGEKLVNDVDMAFELFQIGDMLVKEKETTLTYEQMMAKIEKVLHKGTLSTNARKYNF